MVWSYSAQRNIDRIIKLQKRCIRIITYSEHTEPELSYSEYTENSEYTGPLFSELKSLKVKDVFSLTKLLFMLAFINENVLEELKTVFVINRSINSYKTCSSMVLHIPKAKTLRFGLNTLRYDGANLWNKFCHALLCKEPILTKEKLKKLLQIHFLDTSV